MKITFNNEEKVLIKNIVTKRLESCDKGGFKVKQKYIKNLYVILDDLSFKEIELKGFRRCLLKGIIKEYEWLICEKLSLKEQERLFYVAYCKRFKPSYFRSLSIREK